MLQVIKHSALCRFRIPFYYSVNYLPVRLQALLDGMLVKVLGPETVEHQVFCSLIGEFYHFGEKIIAAA